MCSYRKGAAVTLVTGQRNGHHSQGTFNSRTDMRIGCHLRGGWICQAGFVYWAVRNAVTCTLSRARRNEFPLKPGAYDSQSSATSHCPSAFGPCRSSYNLAMFKTADSAEVVGRIRFVFDRIAHLAPWVRELEGHTLSPPLWRSGPRKRGKNYEFWTPVARSNRRRRNWKSTTLPFRCAFHWRVPR
jgi:hypothetical protein